MRGRPPRARRRLLRIARTVAAVLGLALVCAVPATAQTEPAAPTLYGSLLERETLTGTWGGVRSRLETSGVEIGLTHYGDLMGVVKGGLERRTFYSGLVEPTLAVDLGQLIGWKQARLFLRGIGTYGNDPADGTGSISAPSNIAAVETFKLFEGWLEQSFLDEALSLRVGLYAADTEFDVKETAGVFMNGGFGTTLDLSESGLNGPCIFPTSCLGARVKWQPAPGYYAQIAVMDGVAGDPDNARGTRVSLSSDDGVLLMGEIGYRRPADDGRFFKAALGAWWYSTTFDDVRDVDAAGNPRRRHGSYGFYALAEGELFREGAGSQGLSGFLRAGLADQDVDQIQYSLAGGLAYTGLIPGRDEDVAAIGVVVGINGSKFKQAQRLAGAPVTGEEVAIEGTYRIAIFPWMSLQLDAQYIVNPGTSPMTSDALVIGFRHTVKF